MNWALVGTCALIVGGRICDVTLDTVRTVAVIRGRKHLAVLVGFFEVLIWIFVVARVITGLSQNLLLGICYASGFALGNYVGVVVDEWLAFGDQAMMIISRKGHDLATTLRQEGWRLTEVEAHGREGRTQILLVIVSRKQAVHLQQVIERTDPECFYTVDDVRKASSLAARARAGSSGWGLLFTGR